jgi:hypothetical protein
LKIKFPKLKYRFEKHIPIIIFLSIMVILGSLMAGGKIFNLNRSIKTISAEKDKNYSELQKIGNELNNLKTQYEELKNVDQYKKNENLQNDIKQIEVTYDKAVSVYESLLSLKEKTDKTKDLDKSFASALKDLSDRNYKTASETLDSLSTKIKEEENKLASTFTIPSNMTASNNPPGSGYSRQKVNTDAGEFMVSIVAADLSNTKVIVDTASDSNCSNNCPVLSLSGFISRNNAFAGVNGSYFCPASYPTCAGKTNSFDLLVMNKNKTYFNSDNNVYSNNPAVIFGDGYIRFVSAASQWGRDTSPTGVLSNYPLLVFNSNVAFGGDDDPKKGSKGGRSFVSNKGNTVYIGVVHNATVAEAGRALKALGMENALNLDDGGSTALWSGGYKVGPGRDLANAILFVRK